MNESGAAWPPCSRAPPWRTSRSLVVAHDDLDLDPGRLQLKFGGGLAGHNGLRSIAQVLGTQDFARLRIGIGRPVHKEQVTDYVLKRPTGTRKRKWPTTSRALLTRSNLARDRLRVGPATDQRRA